MVAGCYADIPHLVRDEVRLEDLRSIESLGQLDRVATVATDEIRTVGQ